MSDAEFRPYRTILALVDGVAGYHDVHSYPAASRLPRAGTEPGHLFPAVEAAVDACCAGSGADWTSTATPVETIRPEPDVTLPAPGATPEPRVSPEKPMRRAPGGPASGGRPPSAAGVGQASPPAGGATGAGGIGDG